MGFEVDKFKERQSPVMADAYLRDIKNALHGAYHDVHGKDFDLLLTKLSQYIEEKKESLK